MIKKIFIIVGKDLKIDLNLGHLFFSVAIYLVSSIFVIYISFGRLGINEFNTWISLFWIILLYGSIVSVAKSFLHESENRNYYYYYLFSSSELIFAKLIYNFFFLLILFFMSFGVYSILLGNLIKSSFFFFLLFVGALSISNCLTFISAISYQVKKNSMIMAILSFPLILPILIILINLSKITDIEFSWNIIEDDIYLLILLNIILISLSNFLFKFLWKS